MIIPGIVASSRQLNNALQDPWFNNVALLMNMDGENLSSVFTDQKGHIITTFGDTFLAIDIDASNGIAGSFNETSSHLNASFDVNDVIEYGDFTIEAFVNPDATTTRKTIIDRFATIGTAGFALTIESDRSVWLTLRHNNTASVIDLYSASGAVPLNQYTHIEACRYGDRFALFVGGVKVADAQQYIPSYVVNDTAGFRIGGAEYLNSFWGYFGGKIDGVRVTKGVARHTADFIPPVPPFAIQ